MLALSFQGEPPDPAALSRRWQAQLAAARQIVEILPPAEVGRCVLGADGSLFSGDGADLRAAAEGETLIFHPGRIRGAIPQLKLTG